MANRYWVGTATAFVSSTNSWSATPGGPSGASVPTASDSVFFSQAGTYTVDFNSALNWLDFFVSAGTVTFIGTGALNISGSMEITNVTPTWSATGLITFNATTTGKTITTNGVSFPAAFAFNGTGGVWTLGSSLTTTSATALTISAGTLNTSAANNYALTVNNITLPGTATVGLVLNASVLTITGITSTFNLGAAFNPGTSQINFTNTGSVSITTNGARTFYNVAFSGAGDPGGSVTIPSPCTFNNLSITAPSAGGSKTLQFTGTQTINGVFSTTGTAGNRRVRIQSGGTGLVYDVVINGSTSLTDADFRNIRVTGTAAPISGTRIGNLTGCDGITFSTPKTVYRVFATGGFWAGSNAWSATSGGFADFSFYPLPQDTVIINNSSLNTSATLSMELGLYCGTIDMSTRSTAMTLSVGAGIQLLGDVKLGFAVTVSGGSTLTFAGCNTQTITSVGRTFQMSISIDSPGGIINLADAYLSQGSITVNNGTFNTNGYACTTTQLNDSGTSNFPRTINLSSSTVTLTGGTVISFITPANLTFNARTSQINVTNGSATLFGGSQGTQGLTFNNMSFTATASSSIILRGRNTFNNLTIARPAAAGIGSVSLDDSQTISNTLTIGSGSTAVTRMFVLSSTIGTPYTLTVNTLVATDCDFRDITIAGAAAGGSPTRAGDCGGNSGINFPSAKTVYWNLAGTQNWAATGWASSSGGTPSINNFPLAQDTVVFNNAGAITQIATAASWNIGTVDMSSRTLAMTFNSNGPSNYYGNWTFGSGVTQFNTGTMSFSSRDTQTITSNGITFTSPVLINKIGTLLLNDAFVSTGSLELRRGTFDPGIYPITCSVFGSNQRLQPLLKMGSGVWTITGSGGNVWNIDPIGITFQPNTATIVLSSTLTTARTFIGGGFYYNKLTIGGTTGTSTTTITGNNTFAELASTKTVAHTIDFGATATLIGKWSVTGTAGNLVTVNGTGAINLIGDRVTGIDYLTGTLIVNSTSPVEFYAGANSTGMTGTGIIKTVAPAPVTRYWRGGTGTWNATTTTNWSATSGGNGGASVPTSADTVIFNSASNGSSYTVTLTATQLRCASLSVSGPSTGTLTFAGTAGLSVTQAFTMASTGITSTYNGNIVFSGTGPGKTISAGQTIIGAMQFNGIGASWALTAACTTSATLLLTNGSFDTAGFAQSFGTLAVPPLNPVTLSLGSSTLTSSLATGGINFTNSTTTANPVNFTFNPGTSTINITGSSPVFYNAGKTFYNVAFTNTTTNATAALNHSIFTPTFNNLTISKPSTAQFKTAQLSSNLIINGTFTVNGGGVCYKRLLLVSDTIGTQRTITAAAVSALEDIDMRDINCAGAASWATGSTRIGDLGGNTNAPTSTPKTIYWSKATGGSWASEPFAWATSSGGTPSNANFPLAQDTAIIENTGLNTGASITFDGSWHIGTIDMSGRTNTMTVSAAGPLINIYGNWKWGTGVSVGSSSGYTFSGRGTQTITSNGKSFNGPITINSATGTVQLADALINNSTLTHTSGTFNAVTYNVTCTVFTSNSGSTRTLSMGSGLWTLTGTSTTIWNVTAPGFTLNKDSANIITSAATTNLTFNGGGLTYNKLTIGGGTNASTFTIQNNDNTFSEIASTRTVAYTISFFGIGVINVAAFTAAGKLGGLLTLSGTSAGSPVILNYTGAGVVDVSYVNTTFVRAYPTFSKWTATNSTNNGSYGWLRATVAAAINFNRNFLAFFN